MLLETLSGSEELGEPYTFQLGPLFEDHNIDPDDVVGEPMAVGIKLATGDWRYFHGMVTSFAKLGTTQLHTRYAARLNPLLSQFSYTSDCCVFNESGQDAVSIVTSVLAERGLSDVESGSIKDHAFRAREYCVQYQESDLHFVGVITLVTAPGDGEVAVVADETMDEKDPLLARLLAAAPAGAPPAGPANKRKAIRIVLAPDDRPVAKGNLCARARAFNLIARRGASDAPWERGSPGKKTSSFELGAPRHGVREDAHDLADQLSVERERETQREGENGASSDYAPEKYIPCRMNKALEARCGGRKTLKTTTRTAEGRLPGLCSRITMKRCSAFVVLS